MIEHTDTQHTAINHHHLESRTGSGRVVNKGKRGRAIRRGKRGSPSRPDRRGIGGPAADQKIGAVPKREAAAVHASPSCNPIARWVVQRRPAADPSPPLLTDTFHSVRDSDTTLLVFVGFHRISWKTSWNRLLPMLAFDKSMKEPSTKQSDKCLDSELWHACAGGTVQMPAVDSKVYYFPQGHEEHAQVVMDFGTSRRIPPVILCQVTALDFMADQETDEVFAKIHMVPLSPDETDLGEDDRLGLGLKQEKPPCFAKTLTQSDANNGGGFSVPRYYIPSGWNPLNGNYASNYGGFSAFLREEESKSTRGNGNGGSFSSGGGTRIGGRVRADSVIEAATLAANGQPFEVIGARIDRYKAIPPKSTVTWDEPDLLQNVNCVSPWLVQQASNMPAIHLAPFSPPRKKLRIPQHSGFPLESQLPTPMFPGNPLGHSTSPLCCFPDSTPAGIQGARHAQFGLPLSDFHLNKLQSGLFHSGFHRLGYPTSLSKISTGLIIDTPAIDNNISCLLTIGNTSQSTKNRCDGKPQQLVLFGKQILTEEQISLSNSGDMVSPGATANSSSDGNLEKTTNLSDGSGYVTNKNLIVDHSSRNGLRWHRDHHASELGLETGHCKVFMESDDVGRTLDLSVFASYEELYGTLADMFGIKRSEMMSHVIYKDATGAVKHTGDEPFRLGSGSKS
ncbi:hypothetical protein GW17_00030505 [Ensete ventricosum]|nr:hypothetical protein GW17_00030505 [Ensete ventricosum]